MHMLRRVAMAARAPARRQARRLTSVTPIELKRRHLPGPAGAAEPPLVLVHGIFGMGNNFATVGRKLAARREVVFVDLRNHGGSPWHDDASFEAMRADMEGVLESIGRPVSLCGHSLGGKVAMLTALQRPDLVARLCVADIAPVRYEMEANRAIIEALLAVPETALGDRKEVDSALAASETAIAQGGGGLGNPFVRGFLLQSLQPETRSWRLNLRALLGSYEALRGFPAPAGSRAEMPALFIGGANGGMLQPKHLPACEALFPNARLEMVATGHFVHSEAPATFVELVDRFCADG